MLYVWSDLHLDHRNILNFSGDFREGSDVKEHDEWLEHNYKSVITKKKQICIFLGDVAFSYAALDRIGSWPGTKYLVRGNHDELQDTKYQWVFKKLLGLYSKKVKNQKVWMSHAPIHPEELRGGINIHGHIHQNPLLYNPKIEGTDLRSYVNVSVESTGGFPILLNDVVSGEWKPRF